MADDRLPFAEKHSRDAKLWAIAIIAIALLIAATDLIAELSRGATPRGAALNVSRHR